MASHARGRVSWVDSLAAYWNLVVAFLTPASQPGRHAAIDWPADDPDCGADPEFADNVREWNKHPVVRPEARA